ncbi:MAG: hypothetical protein V4534_07965 [Myxococcota bacterium]
MDKMRPDSRSPVSETRSTELGEGSKPETPMPSQRDSLETSSDTLVAHPDMNRTAVPKPPLLARKAAGRAPRPGTVEHFNAQKSKRATRLQEALKAGKSTQYFQEQEALRQATLFRPETKEFWTNNIDGNNGLTRFIRASHQGPERVAETLKIIQGASIEQLSQRVGFSNPEHFVKHQQAVLQMREALANHTDALAARDAVSQHSSEYGKLRDAALQTEGLYHESLVVAAARPSENASALQIALWVGNSEITTAIIRKLPGTQISRDELSVALEQSRAVEVAEMLHKMPAGSMDSLPSIPNLSIETTKAVLESGHVMSNDTVESLIGHTLRTMNKAEEYRQLLGIVRPNYFLAQAAAGNEVEANGRRAVEFLIKGLKDRRGSISEETTDLIRASIREAAKLNPPPERLQELRDLLEQRPKATL